MIKKLGLWLVPLLFVAVLFYWPMSKLISIGLTPDWYKTYFEAHTFSAIWFTIWQAALSAVISLLLGIPGAYLLYRKTFPGQKFIRAIITVPLVLPTIVVAIAFSNFSWIPSIPLILLAHVFVNHALVVRTIGGVWETIDNETEEAAALAGAGRLRTLIAVSLPQLKPALAAAGSLTFLYCASSYGIILILGGGMVHSIETDIASAALQYLDLPKASALALLQTVITVAAFAVSESVTRKPIGIAQVDESTLQPRVDKRDWLAVVITGAVVLLLVLVPLVTVLSQAFTYNGVFGLANFAHLTGRGSREILNITVWQAALNTLRNLAISSTISVSLGTLVSYLISRNRRTIRARVVNRVFDVAFLLPVGISSVVLGFGYLVTFGDGPLPIRSSWIIVPIVQSLMALPLVIRIIYPALVSIGSEHREASSLAGASAGQTWWYIESGIIRNVIYTAIGFAFIASIGEFGAASLLAIGDQATLPTVLYALISRPGGDNYGMAMAVCALLILLTLALIITVSVRIPRRRQLVGAK
jgi:thiamine transport system permease protein